MKVSFKNSLGREISLTDKGSLLQLEKIRGISPKANIEIAPFFDEDGGTVISARIASRTVTLEIAFNGENANCRRLINEIFIPKIEGDLILENEFGEAYLVHCFVEIADYTIAAREVTATVSLICPNPYFLGAAEQRITALNSDARWTFPFEIPIDGGFKFAELDGDRTARIMNKGAIAGGCVFELVARGPVSNPRLQNINTFEWFELDIDLRAQDRVYIDTQKGQKSVKLVRAGVTTNIINHMVWGSVFLQIEQGLNEITCSAREGLKSLSVTIRFSEKFGGV